MGIDMIVVDDGWFGQRDDHSNILRHWKLNPKKFPDGLQPFAENANAAGCKLGLWLEPGPFIRKCSLTQFAKDFTSDASSSRKINIIYHFCYQQINESKLNHVSLLTRVYIASSLNATPESQFNINLCISFVAFFLSPYMLFELYSRFYVSSPKIAHPCSDHGTVE